jgi:hypothetical protein
LLPTPQAIYGALSIAVFEYQRVNWVNKVKLLYQLAPKKWLSFTLIYQQWVGASPGKLRKKWGSSLGIKLFK